MRLHQRFRQSRRHQDQTQAEVARKAGVTPEHYSKIETGKNQLSNDWDALVNLVLSFDRRVRVWLPGEPDKLPRGGRPLQSVRANASRALLIIRALGGDARSYKR